MSEKKVLVKVSMSDFDTVKGVMDMLHDRFYCGSCEDSEVYIENHDKEIWFLVEGDKE